jgi:glutathione S-transferase
MRGQATIAEVVDLMTKKLTEKLDIYEKILSRQKFMGGNEFSLVDIFYMPYTAKLFQAGDGKLITDRPHVHVWWEMVSSREAWKKITSPKA